MASFLLGGIGSLISGLFGLGAGQKASAADTTAANTVAQAGGAAQNYTQNELAMSQMALNPYSTAGSQAFGTVGSLMQQAAQGTGPLASFQGSFSAPTAQQAEQTPGYQFQLQQGQQALESSAAARGGLLSEGTGKQLEQYGQGLASTNYQQVYNNAMQQYQQQYAQFQNNQSNLYSRLMGVGQTGLSATQTGVGANMQAAQLYGQQGQLAAGQQAGYQAQAGGAQAIGMAGLGNAVGNTVGSIGGAMMQPAASSAAAMPGQLPLAPASTVQSSVMPGMVPASGMGSG
jgi:hypothetical protein